jgi:hypothetical protein
LTKQTKKILRIIVIFIFIIPVVVNFLLWKGTPITFGDDWQGFFGDYFGAVIGGLTAYLLLQLQSDKDDESESKNNRSFAYVEEYYGHYALKDSGLSPNTKILRTEYYETFKKSKSKEELDKGKMAFYKVGHKGYGEVVFNFNILFKYNGIESEDKKHPFQKRYNLPMVSKGEEIYIPFVVPDYNEIEINSIEITYRTMANEYIIFIHNIDELIEEYYSTEVSQATKIISSPIVTTNWDFPS